MKKQLTNSFYICLFGSLLFHTISIFYDQIELSFKFELTKEQVKKIEKIEQNELIAKKSSHTSKDKELILEHLKKEKEEFIKEAKQKFMAKQRKLSQKKTEAKQKALEQQTNGSGTDKKGQRTKLPQVANNFSGFIPKNINKDTIKDSVAKSNQPITLNFLGYVPKEETIAEVKECKGKKYMGLGVSLGREIKQFKTLQEYQSVSQWEISSVAEGYVADQNNIKAGDILLGIKDSNGRLWEGNRLIAKGVPKGTEVEVLIRQQDQVVVKKIVLEEICYEEAKNQL